MLCSSSKRTSPKNGRSTAHEPPTFRSVRTTRRPRMGRRNRLRPSRQRGIRPRTRTSRPRKKGRIMTRTICSIPDCGRYCKGKGLCSRHYQRLRRNGDAIAGRMLVDPILTPEKFWSIIPHGDGCSEWPRGGQASGYGAATYQGEKWYAHRLSYYLSHGEIPSGMEVDHICHNRICVKPSHLRLVTSKQNSENLSGSTSRSGTGLRGVFWDSRRNAWRAGVRHFGRDIHVGQFSSASDANRAVIAKRNELFTHNDLDRIKS